MQKMFLQNSIVAGDAQQTPIISMDISMMHMILAVNFRKSVLNAIMIKAAEAEMEVEG